MNFLIFVLSSSLVATLLGAIITYALFQWGQKRERQRRILHALLKHSSDPTSRETAAALNLLLLEFPKDDELLLRRRAFIEILKQQPRRGSWFEDLKKAYEKLLECLQDRSRGWTGGIEDPSLREPWMEEAGIHETLPLLAREVLLGERRLPVSVRIARSWRQGESKTASDKGTNP